MAITFGGSADVQASAVTSFDIPNVTVGAGLNSFMWVGVGTSAATVGTTTSVTRNNGAGEAFTELFDTISGGTDCHLSGHYFTGPAAGTGTITVVLSSADDEIGAGVVCLQGVDQGAPLGTLVQAQNTSVSPATVTASPSADDWIVDVVYVFATAITVGADQTSRNEEDGINGFSSFGQSTQLAASGGVMSWTFAGNVDWSIGAIPVQAAAGGGASTATIAWLTA
jgi:hypothetical protein